MEGLNGLYYKQYGIQKGQTQRSAPTKYLQSPICGRMLYAPTENINNKPLLWSLSGGKTWLLSFVEVPQYKQLQ
jgi:hypothetical protein